MDYPESALAADPSTISVYWQPGCSSCLKTKEFLTRRGVAFRSVNVLEDGGARDELRSLGARSVPVVARGGRFVYAQSTADIEQFLGLDAARAPALPMEQLLRRLPSILEVGLALAAQLPADRLAACTPRRQRSMAQLLHHIVRIPEVLMLNHRTGRLALDMVVVEPPPDWQSVDRYTDYGRQVLAELRDWCRTLPPAEGERPIDTFYGRKTLHEVTERTAWHDAQHIRQLQLILQSFGIAPQAMLPAHLLDGLPLPEDVWDE